MLASDAQRSEPLCTNSTRKVRCLRPDGEIRLLHVDALFFPVVGVGIQPG